MKLLARLIADNATEYRAAAVLGALLLLNLTGVFRTVYGLDTAILITLAAGYKTFHNSISALLERRISADIALCVAVIAALSAGQYLAAAEAMFIVLVGETLESFAAGQTEAAIERFIAQLPRTAHLLRDNQEIEVESSSLVPGDLVITRAGERLAADGVIEQGSSSIDESSLTGEALPAFKQIGDEVFSGTLNGNGLLHLRVTRAGDSSTLARVVQLVNEAKLQRAPVERLADRAAQYFLPALLLAGALTWHFTHDWSRTVAVLIVACPCALILATPTAMVAAIGGLARRGILVRGGGVLQAAAKVDTAVFDKTGTITEGRFEIVRILTLGGHTEDQVLAAAACAELGSAHPLARVITHAASNRGLPIDHPKQARVVPGQGVECSTSKGDAIRVGNAAFAALQQGAALEAEADHLGATAVFVAIDNQLAGAILLRDGLRLGVREAAAQLRTIGITRQLLLTGDRFSPAAAIAHEAGIPEWEAGLLPEQKLERIRKMKADGAHVAMIGDGINDAPALAAASVGIAVAGAADISAEAAGVVYMGHSLDQLPQLFEVSRRAMRTAWLNIFLFAGAVNLLAVIACATGRLGPIEAALTHQLASFCVMMNSLRLLRVAPTGPDWRGWLRAHRPRIVRLALASALSALVFSGLYRIQPDELGVVERFGRKVEPFSDPGLHYKLPWPVDRLTRIQARRVRSIELGFRSSRFTTAEPSAYEWNVQHRAGRFEARPEESLVLTGDENLVELNAVVHYEIQRPDAFLFVQLDGEATVRASAESVIHSVASSTPLDAILTDGRQALEARAQAELQRRLNHYEAGVHILAVRLEDVHPSTEVVDAFRDVSAAFEEKNRLINEAEAYRNQQVALSRGAAQARLVSAHGYAIARVDRASGDAARFDQQQSSYRTAPGPTETRLYLEAMDQVLPGKKKLIIDAASGAGRRHLLLLEDGVEVPSAALGARNP